MEDNTTLYFVLGVILVLIKIASGIFTFVLVFRLLKFLVTKFKLLFKDKASPRFKCLNCNYPINSESCDNCSYLNTLVISRDYENSPSHSMRPLFKFTMYLLLGIITLVLVNALVLWLTNK